MSSQFALEARGVRKSFPGVRALSGVDIALAPGRVHALLGENGAGKSTLVKILTGGHQPDEGTLRMDGQEVAFASPRDAIARGVTPVYQELTVLPDMSVLDNVMLGHETARGGVLRTREQRATAASALERVALGGIDLDQPAGALSLANQQLIEIARALIRRSTVLILDEPSAVLSGDKLEALHDVVRSLAAAGTAVLYITHLLDEVEQLADDVTILRDGALVSSGPASEYSTARIIREMVGRTVESIYPELPTPGEEVVLTLDGILPRGRSAAPVSLDLRRGEIVGIAGLVGSGRTRLLSMVAGVRSHAGTVKLRGRSIPASLRSRIRAGVVLVPEERKRDGLVLDLDVAANTTLPALRGVSRGGWLSRRLERAAFAEERTRLGIRASGPAQLARQLSGGNQQKVVLGKWLRTAPTVLLLDEPTRGVDVGAKSEIYDIIAELAAEGMSIIVASSELPEVIGISHRVLVCRGGSVVGEVAQSDDSPEEIMHLAVGAAS
jgi:ABC-type sugar transport system ATPase subunit